MHGTTIIARNYLAQARVLARSFLEHHPTGSFSALVLDDPNEEIGPGEPFEQIRPAEIGLDEAELHRMAMLYRVLELSTAVKPWLLRTLLARGEPAVAYLDPDMLVLAPIDDVFELALARSLVLTPHATAPIPADGKTIDERMIRLAGTFNLGLVAVSARAGPFLEWWSDRLARGCRVAPEEGQFVDQRYVDLVPGLFDHVALRDPTVNVAYWNVFQRPIEWTGTRYEVLGRPLRCYHFSGFEPERPWLLSKHQGERPRVLLSEHPGLGRLCGEYADALAREGYPEVRAREYAFARLANGVQIDDRMRTLYGRELERSAAGRSPEPPNPFDAKRPGDFLEWLNEPADGSGVPRYLLALYEERPLHRQSFPDLYSRDAERFLAWIIREGRDSEGLAPELVPATATPSRPSVPSSDLSTGVNIVGYFRAELGIAEVARQLAGALERAGIAHATVTRTETISRQAQEFRDDGLSRARHDTNIVCVNADSFPEFARRAGPAFFANRYTIGVWWWEVSNFPVRFHDAFRFVDEVWVGSDFVRRSVAAATDKPVRMFPLPLAIGEPEPVARSALGLPDSFVFLFSFDFGSVFERKNPLALVAAFERAFEEGEGPVLVLKSINGDRFVSELEQLRLAVAGRSDIRVHDGYVSAEEKNALMAACDCYVSLHRSEGLGLTLAEAMWFGKPVVATGYGGNAEFMTPENSFPVPYELVPIGEGCAPYPPEGRWAAPDIAAAATLLRSVVERPDRARAVGERARHDIQARFAPERTTAFLKEEMARIHDNRTSPPSPGASEMEPAESALERTLAWLQGGPVNSWDAPSRLGWVGRTSRRALRRFLRPYEIRQREFEHAVVGALLEVNHRAYAADQTARSFHGEHESHARILDQDVARLAGALRTVAALDRDLHAVPYTASKSAFRTVDGAGRPAIGFSGRGPVPKAELYRSFEDVFRGPEQFIQDRQRAYLELLAGHAPVLDVGCGRGELLDLLREEEIGAVGIDSDPAMVEHCRSKGLAVEEVEAIDHLTAARDGSIGAIFCAQVIEHLPYESLVRFFLLSRRKLAGGGVLVAETVNPHAIHAFKTFWVDPTHRAPIYPEVAAALSRFAGFESALVVFPHGTGDVEADRRSEGEYAVVARTSAR